jgi:ParB family transcriptional regulator, chromosome partitioning protein
MSSKFERARQQRQVAKPRPSMGDLSALLLSGDEDAASWVAKNPDSELLELDPQELYALDQVRKDFDEQSLRELAESIKNHGQLQPIMVFPKDARGYRICTGERRWRAIKSLGAGYKIQAIVNHKLSALSARDIVILQVKENDDREDINPLERAAAILRLSEEGLSHEEICWHLTILNKTQDGPAPVKISRYLQLLKLPEEGKKLLEDRVLIDLITLDYLRKIYELSPIQFKALCSIARTEGLTRARAEQEYKAVKKRFPTQGEGDDYLLNPQAAAAAPLAAEPAFIPAPAATALEPVAAGQKPLRHLPVIAVRWQGHDGVLDWQLADNAESCWVLLHTGQLRQVPCHEVQLRQIKPRA